MRYLNLVKISISTDSIHTVKPLCIDIPKGRLTTITGVSGSGKTTLILESLYPAIRAKLNNISLPKHVKELNADWGKQNRFNRCNSYRQ